MHIHLNHICGAFCFRKNKIAQLRMELYYKSHQIFLVYHFLFCLIITVARVENNYPWGIDPVN
jgi:hypothetical protein